MAVLLPVFLVLSMYLSSAFSQPNVHIHPKTVTSETYVIEIAVGGNYPKIQWNITEADRRSDPNTEVIAQAINVWAHSVSTPAVLTGQDFQGLKIYHFFDGNHHKLTLPKCTKPKLGQAIIERTSGNALSAKDKQCLLDSIASCDQSGRRLQQPCF